MKAVLEFDLPKEDADLRVAIDGKHWQQILHNVQDYVCECRNMYRDKEDKNEELIDALQAINYYIIEQKSEHDVVYQWDAIKEEA